MLQIRMGGRSASWSVHGRGGTAHALPAHCCQMAVVFLAQLGALQHADRFGVADVEEA
jgi:hypothetical protein